MRDDELIRELGRVQPMLFFLKEEVDYAEPELLRELKLNMSQIFALEILARTGVMTMGELAGAMRANASTMTRVIDGLVDRGMVERTRIPDDRRMVRIRPTQKGKGLARRMQEQRSKHLIANLKLLDDEHQRKFIEVLKAWEKVLGKKP